MLKGGKKNFSTALDYARQTRFSYMKEYKSLQSKQGATSLDTEPYIKQASVMINRTMKTASKSYQQSSSKWSRRLKLTVVPWILTMASAKQFLESAIELILLL
jgi:hypothetical protein